MGDWSTLTLREAGVKLIDCVHKTPTAQDAGYPYVGIPQMKEGWIDFESARKVSRDDFVEWTKKAKPQEHDVILSRRTNPGVTAIDKTGTEFALGQNLVLLRADGHRVHPPFLKWLVRTPAWWGQIDKFMNVGAVFNSLKCADVPNFELPIPPMEVQQEMCVLLDAIDDRIELNRRMNETLEAMARAMFKDWFVDFGPTRAKAEGRAPYLAPEIWNLFPDAFDDEDKPVGWLCHPACDLFEFNPRESVKKGTNAPYLDMAALPTIGAVPDAPTRREYKSGSKFRDGDTLFARITPCLENGKTAYVFGLGDDVIGAGSTEFIVIRSRAPLPQSAGYLLARDPEFRAHAERSMTGTSGRQRANAESLSRYEITAPDDDGIWKALGDLIDPMMTKVIANAYESRTLTQTRALLLPTLMSGEIRLREAEQAVEAVV
jgi:type I restriction enzyme S subunit